MTAPSDNVHASVASPAAPALVPDLRARGEVSADGHALAVRRMFDRISPTYDLLNRLLSLGIDRRWRKKALAALFQDLPEGPLLDLCAGTLDLTLALAERDAVRSLIAADFARDMLLAGRSKVTRAGLVQADAMGQPFADQAFAGVVCGFGMRNLAQPAAGIAEVHRVLRPGGVFVVLEFFRPTRPWTHAFHAFYGNVLLPLVGGMVSGDGSAYRYLSQSMRGFMSRQEFAKALEDAGFVHVTSRDLTLGIASLIVGVK